ncbi:MAG: hydantoinase/oxoprolinase family protein [Alphaproteobacteria bacterium]|nr:hydantoinase/oxoprolinase family protein [Alphaproteobacteria bacterium]
MPSYRIGVDIGGTFTDIVFMDDDGRFLTKKVSSSTDNYAHAIIAGMEEVFAEARIDKAEALEVLHGTTVASNALLELTGAKTGLITTKGFRDVLEIRTLRMPRLYDLHWDKPPPLVERYLRHEVNERVDRLGNVQVALDERQVEHAIDKLVAERVEVIAVTLIHSYANPAHERRIAEIIRERAPGTKFCISSDVLPEIKEYERTSTTVINAYVLPVVERYLSSLIAELKRIKVATPVLLMQSNGGLTTADAAMRMPMNIIESGPAAGVVGAQLLAKRLGIGKVISFDMGGTTAKASLIEDGEVTRAHEYSVGSGIMIGSRLLSGAGYTLKVPAIDLAEVGAGGGSIIWIDPGGQPQVGPRSAGAKPGPACYGQGGTEPTITDASVVLGYINPGFIAGGTVKLDAGLAERAMLDKVAKPLGLDLPRAAHGAYRIAASNMIRAIKAVSSERGRDPREYALVAFGGNGPLFATGMARELRLKRVIVPPAAGLFSCFGLLCSDVEYHFTRTFRRLVLEADLSEFNRLVGELEGEAQARLVADGFPAARRVYTRTAHLHYQGQIYDLSVPLAAGALTAKALAELEEAFGQEHERTYGHRAGKEEPVEVVSIQVIAHGLPEMPRVPAEPALTRSNGKVGSRRAYFGPDVGWLETPIATRGDLATRTQGPCIVEEYDATTLVPPGAAAQLDDFGNIVIDIEG